MSAQRIHAAVERLLADRLGDVDRELDILDIGAGRGELLHRLRQQWELRCRACDVHPERWELDWLTIDEVDLNREPLPYTDDSFDVVTCCEVVEHVENYRHVVREAYRVLRPGGMVVFTTPNVLNMKSRLRYLTAGFFNLFSPLPASNQRRYSLDGHISPIPCFYLGHAMLDAGFAGIAAGADRLQRTSVVWLLVMAPLMLIGWPLFIWGENTRRKTITDENRPLVAAHYSLAVLAGRTLVMSGLKERKEPDE